MQRPDLYLTLLKASSADRIPCFTSHADPRDGTGPLPVFLKRIEINLLIPFSAENPWNKSVTCSCKHSVHVFCVSVPLLGPECIFPNFVTAKSSKKAD